MSSVQLPAIPVDLPSKGKLYPKDNPLSSGVVNMKYMTSQEEDILTNENFIQKGVVVEKLLKSMIDDKFDYDSLLLGDKDYLMLAARILGFGKDYKVKYYPDDSDKAVPVTIDLTSIKEKDIDWSLIQEGKNEFEFELPHSKVMITFKLLTHKDEKEIDAEVAGLIKASKDLEKNVSTRLKKMIIAVAGNRDRKAISDFVDGGGLITLDSRPLRAYIDKVSPGVNFTATGVTDHGETVEGLAVPMTVEFFWPKS